MRFRSVEPEFALKSVPPRSGKLLVERDRLSLSSPRIRDCQVLLLQAPAGFGKTALLAQWRRQWLQRGVSVAWLTLDERDEEMRLIAAMRFAAHVAAPKLATAASDASSDKDAMGAATRWLAEVVAMAAPLALILDDVHALPNTRARRLLEYIVCNAPANLTLALASRTTIDLPAAKRAGSTTWIALNAQALTMTSQETTSALSARFGRGVDKDMAARLHETSEGWALGLQLMSSTIEQGETAGCALALAARAKHGVKEYFTEFLLNRLTPATVDLLLRISLMDAINPELSVALTGRPDSAAELKRLCESTPVLYATVGGNWMKMHPLAREVLRAQAVQMLPAAELQAIHERACEWLAKHGLDEQAAHHAMAAGHADRAYELAERCLYALVLQGNFGRARAHLDRMPAEALLSRPRLALASAYVNAFGEPNAKAGVLLAAVRAQSDLPKLVQQEAACVEISLAINEDNYDRAAELSSELMKAYPTGSADLDQRILNQSAALLLFSGHPHLARHRCTGGTRAYVAGDLKPGLIYRTYVVGLTHLWEGHATLAADVLRLASDDMHLKLDRRNRYSVQLDVALAAAMWELDQPEAAAALLADRLDVIAAQGQPKLVAKGFITASRVAAWEGHEAKRLDLLDYLCTLGEARRSPCMALEALAELIAVHARAGHARSSAVLLERAVAAHAAAVQRNPKTIAPFLNLQLHRCQAYANIAREEFGKAQHHLECAASLAVELRCGRDNIECKLLQALVAHRLGQESQELLHESTHLAEVLGLKRVVADTHPGLTSLIPEASRLQSDNMLAAQRRSTPLARPEALVAPTELLTPKEREILGLISQGLQNKEIAAASAAGQETIKWHISNLLAKLGAANRRHAVARARMLGILSAEN